MPPNCEITDAQRVALNDVLTWSMIPAATLFYAAARIPEDDTTPIKAEVEKLARSLSMLCGAFQYQAIP